MDPRTILFPACLGAVVAAAATPGVARLARALRIVDRPNQRKVSDRPEMPLMGGLAVAAGVAAALLAGLLGVGGVPVEPRQGALLAGSVFVVVLGIVDDRFGLGAGVKFSVQLLAAFAAVGAGLTIDYVTDPVSKASVSLPEWLSVGITVFWILGITNAINLIDGLDGLAAGVSLIIGATLTVICWQSNVTLGVVFGSALVGSLLGFLPFNFAPAKIFLGDTGSLFLGYSLALLALVGYRQLTVITFVVPLLALAFPILDTLMSIVRRVRRGVNPFSADRQHMHHRLLTFAGSHQGACLQVYWVTGAYCLLAVSFTRLEGPVAAACLLAVLLLTVRLLRNLGVMGDLPDETTRSGLPVGREDGAA
jgi:UDP-GlcNAc:undecaprenyl-phosphate GlcNAc-1-phosphate transferase